MSPRDDDLVHTLENVARKVASLDPQIRRGEVGRLILTRQALYYVQGWEVFQEVRRHNGGLFGAIFDLGAGVGLGAHSHEGERLLAEVRALPPASQVEAISGSVMVPVADIETARLALLSSHLKVVTEARGEVHEFAIPWGRRKEVHAWLAGLPRR